MNTAAPTIASARESTTVERLMATVKHVEKSRSASSCRRRWAELRERRQPEVAGAGMASTGYAGELWETECIGFWFLDGGRGWVSAAAATAIETDWYSSTDEPTSCIPRANSEY